MALLWGWSGESSALGLLVTPLLGSLALLALLTPPLVCREGLAVALMVTTPLVCGGGSLASGLPTGDNSFGLVGESAPASAVGDSCSSESDLDGDSSLLRDRGMDTLWSVLTWGLPWSWLKAVSL